MPAPRVTPVDTTGAGDAFSAGFLSRGCAAHAGDVPGHRQHGRRGLHPRAPAASTRCRAPPRCRQLLRPGRQRARPRSPGLAAPAKRGPRRPPPGSRVAEDLVKLAIIGGAGVRVPLLVGGFARSTLTSIASTSTTSTSRGWR